MKTTVKLTAVTANPKKKPKAILKKMSTTENMMSPQDCRREWKIVITWKSIRMAGCSVWIS